MKKRILTIILSVTMVLGAFSLSACTNSELEAKIADLQTQIEELQSSLTEQQEQIAQKDEAFKNYISNNGGLITLSYAYFLGLISKDDLLSIAYYNNYNSNYGNEEIMSEKFVPQSKNPKAISEEVEQDIKEYITEKWIEEYGYTEITFEGIKTYYYVTITDYYGTYGNCVAFSYSESLLGYAGVIIQDKIAGVNFTYASPGDRIFIWVNPN